MESQTKSVFAFTPEDRQKVIESSNLQEYYDIANTLRKDSVDMTTTAQSG